MTHGSKHIKLQLVQLFGNKYWKITTVVGFDLFYPPDIILNTVLRL